MLLALLASYAAGVQHDLSLSFLARQQRALHALVRADPVEGGTGFVLVYIAAVALSLPGAVVLTLAGGLMFGTVLGSALSILGATAGAILLFVAARSTLGEVLARRARPFLGRIAPGLERDGFNYLLALRLVPLVPFWLLNLAPALVGMRLRVFVAATLLGIIPGSVVFASVGAGLGRVLAQGRRPDLSVILRPAVLLPLLGLALLSLAPVAWRRLRPARG